MSSAAQAVSPRGIEVVAGLDERQLRGALTLHQTFAREQGHELDVEAWVAETQAKISEGRFNVSVAWDGDTPIGVTEMHVLYDSMTRENVAYGQRAYVLPEYRTVDVFKAMFNHGIEGCKFLGIDAQRAVAEVSFYGAAMRRFYEANGFKVSGYIMERR